MNSSERFMLIQSRLNEALSPETLNITDDSQGHIGHAPAEQGAGYYTVHVISNAFEGKNLPQRHRMVYDALGDLMKEEIHALSIQAKTPKEATS